MFTNGYASGDEPKVIEIVEEDVLEKCWKALPRSVYSSTATDTTHYSTVSGITENNPSAKSTVSAYKEKDWKILEERTAALEKAAADLAATEKTYQVEFKSKNTAWMQSQKQTITDLQEKNETFTRTMIMENLDMLLQESEEAKDKNKEMEEWQIEFDAKQKKRFRNQEKKISKKIDSKISNLSSAIDNKLQAHQDQSIQLAKQNKQYMNDSLAKIFTFMANLKQTTDTHTNAIRTIQDYTQKENRKRQKRGVDDNNIDNDMEDMEDSDALQVKFRDALAPGEEYQGGT
jgi:hypothetical protein